MWRADRVFRGCGVQGGLEHTRTEHTQQLYVVESISLININLTLSLALALRLHLAHSGTLDALTGTLDGRSFSFTFQARAVKKAVARLAFYELKSLVAVLQVDGTVQVYL